MVCIRVVRMRGFGIWIEALGVGGLGLVDGLVPVEVGLVALEEEGVAVGFVAGVGDGGGVGV